MKPVRVNICWSKYRTVFFRLYIGDNPVRVWIRNRTGENTQKVSFGCTPARGLNKVILKFAMVRGQQMPTPTKKSQQPSKWVLMTRKDTQEGPTLFFMKFPQTSSPSMLTTSCRFECFGLWEFVVKIIAKCRTAPLLSNVHWQARMHMLSPRIQIPLTFPLQCKITKKALEFSEFQQFLTEIYTW